MAEKTRGKTGAAISPALAKALGEGEGGGYELSSAFADPERRKFLGAWEILEHRVEGRPYLERYRERSARSLKAEGAEYRARYEFTEGLCTKRVGIEGLLETELGERPYVYRMAVALSWSILPGGFIRVRPELGYRVVQLDGSPVAAEELSSEGEEDIVLRYRFSGEELILEEGSDVKRLGRLP